MRKLELLLIVLPLLTWQPSLGAQEAAELQSSRPDDPAWIVVQQLSPQSELQVFDGALARLTQEEADEALADLDAEAIESAAAELEAKLASGELGLSEEERNRIERITALRHWQPS